MSFKLLRIEKLFNRMHTSELVQQSRRMGLVNFLGVFPLDKLPCQWPKLAPSCFIVNTDTHKLSGRHWLAVSFERGGIVRAFDPLGILYPSILTSYLAKAAAAGGGGGRVMFNRTMYQDPKSKTCGQHCLQWLKWRNDIINSKGMLLVFLLWKSQRMKTCLYVCVYFRTPILFPLNHMKKA